MACSSTKDKRKVIVPEGEAVWIYSPESGCDKDELCAVGEGSSLAQADAKSKQSLASIFETKIQSSLKFSKHSFSGEEIEEMQEYINSDVSEKVDGVLKGAIIKERFQKEKIFFSLVSLDKNKAAQLISNELKHVDDQLNHFYSFKSRIYIKKLNVLFNKRLLLAEKMTILKDSASNSPISFKQIEELKLNSMGGTKIVIKTTNEPPRFINKKVKEIFSELGYKLVKKGNDYFINMDYKVTEEYLNVKGFKKFSYTLAIESRSNIGKKLGNFIITVTESGRNEVDAFTKSKSKLIEKFENNIEKLNLK
jgi:hypothetical protein